MVSRLCDDGVQGRDGRCVENSSCFQIFLFVPVCILLLGSPAGLIFVRWGPGLTRLLAKRGPAEIVCVKRSNFRRETLCGDRRHRALKREAKCDSGCAMDELHIPGAEIVLVERSNVRRNARSGWGEVKREFCFRRV